MKTISQERLKELLDYDPVTGLFRWRLGRGGENAGTPTNFVNQRGYVIIGVDYKRWPAHVLAWIYMTGEMPVADLDHIDGDRSNNRWRNLRPATRSQNNANSGTRNKTGLPKGVRPHPRSDRFIAQISIDKKTTYLGCFLSPEEAHAAYCRKAQEIYGEYHRAG